MTQTKSVRKKSVPHDPTFKSYIFLTARMLYLLEIVTIDRSVTMKASASKVRVTQKQNNKGSFNQFMNMIEQGYSDSVFIITV